MTQVATFYLNDKLYGLDILLIREINRAAEFTPVALAPEYVKGLMNLRGQIVTVLDLRTRLGLPPAEGEGNPHVVILKGDEELRFLQAHGEATQPLGCPDAVGFLVDGIGDVVDASETLSEPTPPNVAGVDSAFLSGVMTTDNDIVVRLDVRAIVKVD